MGYIHQYPTLKLAETRSRLWSIIFTSCFHLNSSSFWRFTHTYLPSLSSISTVEQYWRNSPPRQAQKPNFYPHLCPKYDENRSKISSKIHVFGYKSTLSDRNLEKPVPPYTYTRVGHNEHPFRPYSTQYVVENLAKRRPNPQKSQKFRPTLTKMVVKVKVFVRST